MGKCLDNMVCTSFELDVIHSIFHCFILPQPLDVIQNKYRPSSTEKSFIYLKICILFPVTLFGNRHFCFFLFCLFLCTVSSSVTEAIFILAHFFYTSFTVCVFVIKMIPGPPPIYYLLFLIYVQCIHLSIIVSYFFFSSQSHCIVILCFLPKAMNHFLSSAVKLYVPSACYLCDGHCGVLLLLILDSREETYIYLYYIQYYLI